MILYLSIKTHTSSISNLILFVSSEAFVLLTNSREAFYLLNDFQYLILTNSSEDFYLLTHLNLSISQSLNLPSEAISLLTHLDLLNASHSSNANLNLLTISHISRSSNELSHSSEAISLLTLLNNSKKLSKTLTFSFTLRKLYDIIVLVNQQKLTFDSKIINTSLILTKILFVSS